MATVVHIQRGQTRKTDGRVFVDNKRFHARSPQKTLNQCKEQQADDG